MSKYNSPAERRKRQVLRGMAPADTAESLLREALEFLNDRPSFGLRRDQSNTTYKLAARIDRYFAGRS